MKLSSFLSGAVFFAGVMIGFSSVNAAPKATFGAQDAVETQEEEVCCIMLLTKPVCVITPGPPCTCSNCGISDTDGVAAEEEEVDLTVKPLRLPFGS